MGHANEGRNNTPQKKKDWISRGMEFVEAGGFDPKFGCVVRIVEDAYKSCSFDHAASMGDETKPVDYDFHYPASDEIFRDRILQECASRDIPRLPPVFDLVSELQKIDPAYDGNGSKRDVFNILSRALQSDDQDVLSAVDHFRTAAGAQKKHEFASLAVMVSQIRSMVLE